MTQGTSLLLRNGKLLDLASGTGVISHLMNDMGFVVTGLDWSEAMLAQARAKAKKRRSSSW